MNIVIPDGYTLNPGDLTWDSVKKFGNVIIHNRTAPDDMPQRCEHADIILTNKAPVSRQTIERATSLKLICVTATGYNIVDVDAARERNIPVSNVPGYGTASVAQHTIALMLEIANHVGTNSTSVAAGDWTACPDFSYSKGSITELSDKTLGIVGFGMIGQQVARIAQALGMNVVYSTRTPKRVDYATHVSLDALFSTSDVVSLHCPLTKENFAFVNKDLINKMKHSAWMINTARGQLIQEQDLADALNGGRIAAAGLDVLSSEPPPASNPLLGGKNCLVTPHTAWISIEARQRILRTTEENIESFLNGSPTNVVN